MTALAEQILVVALVLIVTVGPGVAAALLLIRRKQHARANRRSPLTTDLLRTAGHGLRIQLEEMRQCLFADLIVLFVVPAFPLAYINLQSMFAGSVVSWRIVAVGLVGSLIFSIYQIRKMRQVAAQTDKLSLGLDAELAVGQELDQLMREGAVVFHDFPAEKFNIDHIVIAPQGIYAVETKGYAKPNRGGGAAEAKVVFDGRGLAFPDWSTTKPLEQAARQARWLANWLSRATGEPVRVLPIVALPGWFVERKGRGDVLVYSGKELRGNLLKVRHPQPLVPEQLRRVAHQVEQRCRNVNPLYGPDRP